MSQIREHVAATLSGIDNQIGSLSGSLAEATAAIDAARQAGDEKAIAIAVGSAETLAEVLDSAKRRKAAIQRHLVEADKT
ncbi:hypothetical protein [Labrys monachus]|uniref:Uncharacterized protein n=1 Tax=Labrys monachus TaxID=217067 RepID=A0ABU0FKP5_9HYPH|nr:hypothetical protein [Labrys monachus]MDQ0395182.1 hypothetical protein [Labrys monachus]